MNVPLGDADAAMPSQFVVAQSHELKGPRWGNYASDRFSHLKAAMFPGCGDATELHIWYWLEQTARGAVLDAEYLCTHVAISLNPDALVQLARRLAESDDLHDYTIYQTAERTSVLALWHSEKRQPPRTGSRFTPGAYAWGPEPTEVVVTVEATTSTLLPRRRNKAKSPALPYSAEMALMSQRSRELGVLPQGLVLPTSRREGSRRVAASQRALSRMTSAGVSRDADGESKREAARGPFPRSENACSSIGPLIEEYESYTSRIVSTDERLRRAGIALEAEAMAFLGLESAYKLEDSANKRGLFPEGGPWPRLGDFSARCL